jgi:peptidoglycan-associated lipoprotein
MITCQASVVIVSLLMALAVGGCATQQSATNDPSATAGYHGSAMGSRHDGPGGTSGMGASARPRLSEFIVQDDLRDVHFEFDSYEIRATDIKILEKSTQWLRAHPEALVVIEGHADERGTNEYNLTLGERRAKASMNYLVSHGIAATRITVMSYGEERGMCRDHAESCWAKNRRAHFLVKAR